LAIAFSSQPFLCPHFHGFEATTDKSILLISCFAFLSKFQSTASVAVVTGIKQWPSVTQIGQNVDRRIVEEHSEMAPTRRRKLNGLYGMRLEGVRELEGAVVNGMNFSSSAFVTAE
jgi:hypothetical protein